MSTGTKVTLLFVVNRLSITLYVLIALLNIASFVIAVYIAYKTWRVSRIIKDSALELVSLGYIILSIGLILSFTAATLSAINLLSSTTTIPCPHYHEGWHTYSKWGYHEPPPWSGYRSYWSWSTIMFTGIVYPIAYLLIFIGLRKEYLSVTSIEQVPGKEEGVASVLLSPIYLYGLIGESASIALLFLTIYYVLKSDSSSWIGYFALMISHVLRLVAILSDNPWIFLLGEIARPLGLIIIMLGLVKKP